MPKLLFMLMLARVVCFGQSQPKDADETLRGFTTMRVHVTFENIQSGQEPGESSTFQPYVERRLRNAGIKIDNRPDFYPSLVMRLSRTSNDAVGMNKMYGYCVTLHFTRTFMDSDKRLVAGATYLPLAVFGFAGVLRYDDAITDSVNTLVDAFTRDWKSANR